MRWRSLGCDGCLEWGCPAPLDSCLRRNDEWGCAGTTRDGDAPAPRRCPGFPLSRERRWGSAGRQALLVAKGWGPAGAGRPFESLRVIGIAKRPYGRVGEATGGWWWGAPRGPARSYDPSLSHEAEPLRRGDLATGTPPLAPLLSVGPMRLMAWDPVLGSR